MSLLNRNFFPEYDDAGNGKDAFSRPIATLQVKVLCVFRVLGSGCELAAVVVVVVAVVVLVLVAVVVVVVVAVLAVVAVVVVVMVVAMRAYLCTCDQF